MHVRGITITGADDNIAHDHLQFLCDKYPFVEFGVLLSMTRAGAPRYPSPDWISALRKRKHIRYAFHLCGSIARDAMECSERFFSQYDDLPARVQLNGFPGDAPRAVEDLAKRRPGTEFIMQVRDFHSACWACETARNVLNVSALSDVSGGEGKPAKYSPVPSCRMGYAGGIGPSNVLDALERAHAVSPEGFWLDMESGVRTNDRWDDSKVKDVLNSVAAVITPEDPDAR